MKYLESQNLTSLTESDTRILIKQIATGVKEIHGQGIAHRDIKHLNILISIGKDGGPVAKIGDFGMAAKLNKGETITRMAGTIGYMAPEVVLNLPSDSKSDIWSLGVVLFALISGSVPFSGKTREETSDLIVHSELNF